MKIVFVDSCHPLLLERLEAAGHTCIKGYELPLDEVLGYLVDAAGIVIRSRFKIGKAEFDSWPELRFVARVGAGMENIDLHYARQKGVACLHAPEGNSNAVGEHALAMLLALLNNLVKADKEVRQGKWLREENRGYELDGKTVGIVGYGFTGSAFARKLRGFEVKVLAYDKYRTGFGDGFVKESSMEELFAEADVLSLHIPLTAETHYLVSDAYLERFSKPIWLINTSRGKCLHTEALLRALDTGKVRGAALDVLEFESVSFENLSGAPEAFSQLVQRSNVVLSSHIAGWTFESNEKMALSLFHKIQALAEKAG